MAGGIVASAGVEVRQSEELGGVGSSFGEARVGQEEEGDEVERDAYSNGEKMLAWIRVDFLRRSGAGQGRG